MKPSQCGLDYNGDSMQFTLETTTQNYVIRAYTAHEVIVTPPEDLAENVKLVHDPRFGDQPVALELLSSSFYLAPRQLVKNWAPSQFENLELEDFDTIIDNKPEILLLGTGSKLQWPKPGIREKLLGLGIGIEVMDPGAACRTYNILMAELRDVSALIFI